MQILYPQFESGCRLRGYGGMVDTTDLKSVDQLVVRVQVPLPPREWRQASKIFGWGKNNSWNFFPRESLVNDHREEREQERKTKVIVQLEQQNNQLETMEEIFQIMFNQKTKKDGQFLQNRKNYKRPNQRRLVRNSK